VGGGKKYHGGEDKGKRTVKFERRRVRGLVRQATQDVRILRARSKTSRRASRQLKKSELAGVGSISTDPWSWLIGGTQGKASIHQPRGEHGARTRGGKGGGGGGKDPQTRGFTRPGDNR